jgi:hypothetical protein
MDALTICNTAVIGLLFMMWHKKDLFNFSIKSALFVLVVSNILRLAGKL